jgi:hypothetical protein
MSAHSTSTDVRRAWGRTHTCGAGYPGGRFAMAPYGHEKGGAHGKTPAEQTRYEYRLGAGRLAQLCSWCPSEEPALEDGPTGSCQGPAPSSSVKHGAVVTRG